MSRTAALRLATLATLGALTAAAGVQAEESFDAAAYDKKAFEWTGYVEARPERQWLRTGSTGYLLAYPGETRQTATRLSAAAELSGVLRHQDLSFNFTAHGASVDEPRGSDHDGRMYEAYAAWQIDPGSNVEIGKRALRWGKGYAWSPVAFLERLKDPADPELAREGYVMATAAHVRSFDGPLQALALTAAVVPTTGGLNEDYGDLLSTPGHANPALKLYALLLDTDIDLVWAAPGSRGPRFGIDFSRNLGSNLEVHGEWARIGDAPRAVLTPSNSVALETRSYDSALIGLRYLTARDTTLVFELYRNGGGYSTDELAAFHDLVRAAVGNPALSGLASRVSAQGYNRPNAGERYAYLRASQKEPFDVLDFTPSVTTIVNTRDGSWSLIPELLYIGIRNLELRGRLALNRGDADSEFGEKAVESRLELRARLYF